jgi:formiminotetrahydrofolate cyclodeaminase
MPDGPDKQATMNAAILACVRVPEAIGAAAVRVLEIADEQVNHVNPFLLSDLAVCADLAMATARCSIYSVRANLPDVTDPADRRAIESTISQMLSRAGVLIQRVSPRIWARHGQNG